MEVKNEWFRIKGIKCPWINIHCIDFLDVEKHGHLEIGVNGHLIRVWLGNERKSLKLVDRIISLHEQEKQLQQAYIVAMNDKLNTLAEMFEKCSPDSGI